MSGSKAEPDLRRFLMEWEVRLKVTTRNTPMLGVMDEKRLDLYRQALAMSGSKAEPDLRRFSMEKT